MTSCIIRFWLIALFVSINCFSQAQELDHKILIRDHSAPRYAPATFLVDSHVNSKGRLVSLVKTSALPRIGPIVSRTVVQATNGEFEIKAGQHALFETDQDGKVSWRTEISIKRLNPDPDTRNNGTFFLMNTDLNDNYYLTFISSRPVQVEFNGVAKFDLRSSRTTTIKLDANGQFKRIIRSKIISTLGQVPHSIVVKNNLIYYLYSQFESNADQSFHCRLLRQFIEVRSLDGQLVRETSFTAKDDRKNRNKECYKNQIFLIRDIDVDNDGNIYLAGQLRGEFTTSLNRSITADKDKDFRILIKLDSNFLIQWYRIIPSSDPFLDFAHKTLDLKLMASGDILFLNVIQKNPIYDFRKTSAQTNTTNQINTTNYEKINSDITVSLSKIDPSGNLVWINFFDRPISFSTDQSNNQENIWINIAASSGNTSFIYYDVQQDEHRLENSKYPDSGSSTGYLRLDGDGNYIGHRFLTVLSNGSRDSMFPTLLPLNVDCKEFYIVARFEGSVDISFEQNVAVITSESIARAGDIFIAKFANAPPSVEVDNSDSPQCPESVAQIPFVIIDENTGNLRLEVSSSNEAILPGDSLSIINDNGQYFIQVLAGKTSGSFKIILRITDECDIVTVEEIPWVIRTPPAPPAIINLESLYNLCDLETVVLTASIESPVWSNGATSKSITINDPGLYWVTATDAFGCTSVNSDTVEVVVFRTTVTPLVSISGSTQLCEGESVTLTTDLDRNIIWSNGETTQSITINQSGIYTVHQFSQRCGDGLNSDAIEVVVNPIPEKPIIQIEGALEFCEGNSVRLNAPVANGARWSNGSTDQRIEVTQSGKYWLEIEVNGCLSPASDTLDILVAPDFNFQLTRDATVCTGFEEVELTPKVDNPDVELLWSDGSVFSSLIISEKGEYWVEASNGVCRKDRIFIKVEHACFPRVYIPNAFTPNNDSFNDTFEAKGVRMTSFNIQIFNKWGNQLFESSSLLDQWDGTFQGQKAPVGSYTYRIVYTGENATGPTEFVKRGSFRLIR